MNFLESMKALITRKTEPVLIFKIDRFQEMDERNPELVQELEVAFAGAGALPAHVNTEDGIFALTITDPRLTTEEILAVFSQHGCPARRIDEHSVSS